MKKEAIIAIIVVGILTALLIVLVSGALDPNPPVQYNAVPSTGYTMYPGMMGPGMMGSGMMGPGMMNGMGMMSLYSANSQPIALTDARNRAQVVVNQNYPGAKIGDFMEFSFNYYVELQDASNQSFAEILVDRYSGAVTPEPGPNMMWNTRYWRQNPVTPVYDMPSAKSLAEKFLAGYLPGATVQDSTQYPGYYTFDIGRGRIEGMLSVNAYTGAIWVHTWHGPFIGE